MSTILVDLGGNSGFGHRTVDICVLVWVAAREGGRARH